MDVKTIFSEEKLSFETIDRCKFKFQSCYELVVDNY